MAGLIRDTLFGHLLRLISHGKILPYEEDRDPSLWKRYVDTEKSGRVAHHGHTGEEEIEDQQQAVDDTRTPRDSRGSSSTRVGSHEGVRNEVNGVRVDPEKGKDVTIVTWLSEDDPEVGIVSRR
jgi:DHA1 family multidrug resistance protein-like MFS transporter